jgi:hypothetical protein
MNRSFDELEAELRSLRPRVPSDRVRSAITSRLSPHAEKAARANFWLWGAAVLAMAAGVMALLVFWPRSEQHGARDDGTRVVERPIDDDSPRAEDVVRDVNRPPTLLAYRRRLDESMESFDKLLEQHARCLLTCGSTGLDSDLLIQEIYQN